MRRHTVVQQGFPAGITISNCEPGWRCRARKYSELRNRMPGERRARNAREARVRLVAMELADLRRELGLTQEQLAERLGIAQTNVSKMERRSDMLLSSLRDVVRALGGEIEVTAHFPDRDVRLCISEDV